MPVQTDSVVSGPSSSSPQALESSNSGAQANILRYEPLEIQSHEIRLLWIRPADDPVAPIECSLETISLQYGPFQAYIALSYEWGPNMVSDMIQISVNDCQVRVTINLATALLLLRQRIAGELPIWIDAICINQADDRERGSQVAFMADIYRCATTTWAYLGHNYENGRLAMELIVEAGENLLEGVVSSDWLQAKLSDERSIPALVALCRLFERPYWRRNWIVQELAVANQPMLLCGLRIASLEYLDALFRALAMLHLQPNVPFQPLNPDTDVLSSANWISAILLTRSGYHRGGEQQADLLELLRRCIFSVVTDPRDKIYSLIGIAKPYPGSTLPIDYTLSTSEVYEASTIHIIRGSGKLDVLAMAGPSSLGMPSWVPDWSYRSNLVFGVVAQERAYSAGGNGNASVTFSPSRRWIHTRAAILGTTAFILPARDSNSLPAGVRDTTEDFDPVSELQRRLRSMAFQYYEALGHPRPGERTLKLTTAYLSMVMYKALFHTKSLPETVHATWDPTDFASFSITLITMTTGPNPTCTPFQTALLRTALTQYRCVFISSLPPPFRLIDDMRLHLSSLPDDEVAVLSPAPFPTVGLCKRQEGWGQGLTVAVVPGCSLPLLLRRDTETGRYTVISEAYVHGVMAGEAVERLPLVEITLC